MPVRQKTKKIKSKKKKKSRKSTATPPLMTTATAKKATETATRTSADTLTATTETKRPKVLATVVKDRSQWTKISRELKPQMTGGSVRMRFGTKRRPPRESLFKINRRMGLVVSFEKLKLNSTPFHLARDMVTPDYTNTLSRRSWSTQRAIRRRNVQSTRVQQLKAPLQFARTLEKPTQQITGGARKHSETTSQLVW